jgi:BirA family transcriptional regulator, biotin operon repressor / biotin---[acetyl-CoA-carboxylase] ligase
VTLPPAWPDGIRLRRYDVLDSTNEEAIRLARGGEVGPLWICAAQQTAGRGRRGRAWASEPGNLFATLLTEAARRNSAQTGFIAAISVVEAIRRFVPGDRVRIKWPNDILIGAGKCAGILVEQVSDRLVAVGIGIDLVNYPSGVGAVSLSAVCGFIPAPDHVLASVAQEMDAWLSLWTKSGFTPVREAWLARAAGMGELIRAATPLGNVDGIFENLDSDGALLLRDAGGMMHRITAADVFYGTP